MSQSGKSDSKNTALVDFELHGTTTSGWTEHNQSGTLNPKSVPTLADRFTLDVALKFRVTNELDTTDLNAINDFSKPFVELIEVDQEDSIEQHKNQENILPNVVKMEVGENSVLQGHFGCHPSSDNSGWHDSIAEASAVCKESCDPSTCLGEIPYASNPYASPAQAHGSKPIASPSKHRPRPPTARMCTNRKKAGNYFDLGNSWDKANASKTGRFRNKSIKYFV